jgi:hypothetical protein
VGEPLQEGPPASPRTPRASVTDLAAADVHGDAADVQADAHGDDAEKRPVADAEADEAPGADAAAEQQLPSVAPDEPHAGDDDDAASQDDVPPPSVGELPYT